ncbi:MAG TPA: hypothetical protein PKE40_02760 [Arachnia sp.]|nr:hypothetical protein [Arachnia sp.]HMT85252.1 hypothetical protein [Arachnia sp.]
MDDNTRQLFREWADQYQQLAHTHAVAFRFLPLGQAIFEWLDSWATAWFTEPGPRELEIFASTAGTEEEVLLLGLPWEVLATDRGFLAADGMQLFHTWRRIGQQADVPGPGHSDLSLLFMAAEPISRRVPAAIRDRRVSARTERGVSYQGVREVFELHHGC